MLITSPVAAAPGAPSASVASKAAMSSCTTSEPASEWIPSTTGTPITETTFSGNEIAPVSSTISSAQGLGLSQLLMLADTAADRFDLLPDNTQFIFDFNQRQGAAGEGGNLTVANRKTFPALIGTGAGMAVGHIGPCGLNTLHVHPRSAELQLVVEGRLVTEMAPENGVVDSDGKRRVIRNEVGPLQMTPFYQGSVHTQFNPDCTDAIFVASFASEDFGTGLVLDQTFAFADDVVAAAFGQAVVGEDIDAFREAIPTNIALGVEECLQRCGIEKRVP
ncbi:Spherulin-1B [Fusarium oxysporum f. sp. raphani]|uniref:Spherulin-1B n=1 Tax=Fusarium oxysporum f. sp. raphani TaxID=96318 RepID=A0A8J5PYU3_FUSOX|nr:Spherulin-1B [Fusarium oxysporum f. sp. raphani]